VTEEITGQDLVEWQLRLARGEPLPCEQDELEINGWAFEARLYAEDPTTFLPSTGRLERCHFPEDYVRVETGVEQGSVISPFYDPMIAKIITSADTRGNALALLAQKLEGTAVWPVKSNAAFLHRAATHPAFIAGNVTTGFLAEHAEDLTLSEEPDQTMLREAARELVSQYEDRQRPALNGFRLNAPREMTVRMTAAGKDYAVKAPDDFDDDIYSSAAAPDVALVTERGLTFGVGLARYQGGATGVAGDGAILAPMPGRVTTVEVAAGASVVKGQKLLTLEAMKMEHALTAPFDGVVAELNAEPGAQVSEGTLLAKVERAAG